MTIAILGGRFDPPHWGHWWVARQVLEKRAGIDEVWFVPAAQHQWKETEASGKDRFTMLKTFEDRDFRVSDLEIERGGVSYTVDTVREIKKRFGYKVYWIVGSDIIEEFSRWEKAKELSELVTFLVFPRDPYQMPKNLPAGFEAICGKDLVVTNLSSTVIRKRVKEGRSIRGFVPVKVEEYILSNGLYRKLHDSSSKSKVKNYSFRISNVKTQSSKPQFKCKN